MLGTVQEEKEPYTQQAIPVGGLELYFDLFLQGKAGKRLFLRSPRQPLDAGKLLSPPVDGSDIYLTVNHYLQAIAEEEVKNGVEKVHGKGGWAVVMNPHTGEILACAQYPFFQMTEYSRYFSNKDLEQHTRPKAVCDAFEPGSVFKPITVAIAFLANEELKKRGEKPLFDPEEKIPTSDGKFPGRKKLIKDAHLHSFLNMDLGLQKSSNVYMARLTKRVIDRLGEEWYHHALVDLIGLGKKTGVELLAETSGQVPNIGKFHPSGKPEWSVDTPYSLAFGHNVLVNTMQLSCFFSMLANGGLEIKPTLIKKIVQKNPTGEEEILFDLEEKLQHQEKRRVLSKEITHRLIQGLKYVTKRGGTSPSADVPGFSEAGKSGTSEKIINGQYSQERYISSFVGIVPANDPKFVIAVVVDEPEAHYIPGVGKSYHGGVCAGPIFKEIAIRTLKYLGIAPDDPFGYPGKKKNPTEKADWEEEIKKLAALYNLWNKKS